MNFDNIKMIDADEARFISSHKRDFERLVNKIEKYVKEAAEKGDFEVTVGFSSANEFGGEEVFNKVAEFLHYKKGYRLNVDYDRSSLFEDMLHINKPHLYYSDYYNKRVRFHIDWSRCL